MALKKALIVFIVMAVTTYAAGAAWASADSGAEAPMLLGTPSSGPLTPLLKLFGPLAPILGARLGPFLAQMHSMASALLASVAAATAPAARLLVEHKVALQDASLAAAFAVLVLAVLWPSADDYEEPAAPAKPKAPQTLVPWAAAPLAAAATKEAPPEDAAPAPVKAAAALVVAQAAAGAPWAEQPLLFASARHLFALAMAGEGGDAVAALQLLAGSEACAPALLALADAFDVRGTSDRARPRRCCRPRAAARTTCFRATGPGLGTSSSATSTATASSPTLRPRSRRRCPAVPRAAACPAWACASTRASARWRRR
ncbi:MAG: hypothetical protein J3K34DRAFT_433006 [Monoraphidium minutum]|nr:MAG: hypothetical protein J3K34DRAFT_433006 [Monoraphidium minutum]